MSEYETSPTRFYPESPIRKPPSGRWSRTRTSRGDKSSEKSEITSLAGTMSPDPEPIVDSHVATINENIREIG